MGQIIIENIHLIIDDLQLSAYPDQNITRIEATDLDTGQSSIFYEYSISEVIKAIKKSKKKY